MAGKKTIYYKIEQGLKYKFLWWPVKPKTDLNQFSTTYTQFAKNTGINIPSH